MKNTLPILALVLFIMASSCRPKNTPQHQSTLKGTSLIIGDPFNYGLENLVLFPVGANYSQAVLERSGGNEKIGRYNNGSFSLNVLKNKKEVQIDKDAWAEYENRDDDFFDIRNILFRDLKTAKTYTLTQDTVHILSFALHKEFERDLIFYRIVKSDYNKDSMYTAKDAVQLYMSDLDGKNFVQITPDSENFVSYQVYPDNNIMLVKTNIDRNEDGKFTSIDETNFREVNLKKPELGIEIFTDGLKDSLRSLIGTN